MSGAGESPPREVARSEREKRLADALRANLRRRKAAARAPAPEPKSQEEQALDDEDGGDRPASDGTAP